MLSYPQFAGPCLAMLRGRADCTGFPQRNDLWHVSDGEMMLGLLTIVAAASFAAIEGAPDIEAGLEMVAPASAGKPHQPEQAFKAVVAGLKLDGETARIGRLVARVLEGEYRHMQELYFLPRTAETTEALCVLTERFIDTMADRGWVEREKLFAQLEQALAEAGTDE